MPVYISMLRGVNLGPHNRMKMEQLRKAFEMLGFERVQTYIQSGNVVFKSKKQSPLTLSKRVEDRIMADFGFSVPVITRTSADMQMTIQGNPFLKKRGVDVAKLHVTFFSQAPQAALLQKLASLNAEPDEFHCCGKVVYLHCPSGYAETKLSNGFFEKALSLRATTRNWKTVNQLYEMALRCD